MMIPLFILKHRATIIPFKGSGGYGPVWETDPAMFRKDVPCLIELKTKQTTNTTGTDVVKTAEGIFRPDVGIKANDKVIYKDAEYIVKECSQVENMGPYSVEVVMS